MERERTRLRVHGFVYADGETDVHIDWEEYPLCMSVVRNVENVTFYDCPVAKALRAAGCELEESDVHIERIDYRLRKDYFGKKIDCRWDGYADALLTEEQTKDMFAILNGYTGTPANRAYNGDSMSISDSELSSHGI